MSIKKQRGVFYTNQYNPFAHERFIRWAKNIALEQHTILEPFAGANHLIHLLQGMGLCKKFASFDIDPQNKEVVKRDTIVNFPRHYTACITNPPWLYKSRAKRLRLHFPNTIWDNLYKHCLALCLEHCQYLAILLPASFLSSNIFLERLESVVVIQHRVFEDTENPVCLAMFTKEHAEDTDVFVDDRWVGTLSKMNALLPKQSSSRIRFNVQNGDLGLVAIDNAVQASIRFCRGDDLKNYAIRNTSRSITRISIDNVRVRDGFIMQLNNALHAFRNNTYDIFLTAFKGIRADGHYRRRLDYSLARKLIAEHL